MLFRADVLLRALANSECLPSTACLRQIAVAQRRANRIGIDRSVGAVHGVLALFDLHMRDARHFIDPTDPVNKPWSDGRELPSARSN
jgi:hypothetical protein